MLIVVELSGVRLLALPVAFVREFRVGAPGRGGRLPHRELSSVGVQTCRLARADNLQRSRPNSWRNFPFAVSRVSLRSAGRFRPARLM